MKLQTNIPRKFHFYIIIFSQTYLQNITDINVVEIKVSSKYKSSVTPTELKSNALNKTISVNSELPPAKFLKIYPRKRMLCMST